MEFTIFRRQSNVRIPRLRRFLIGMLQAFSSPPSQSTLFSDSIQFKVQINSPAKLTLSRVSPRALMGGIFLRRFFPEGRPSKLLQLKITFRPQNLPTFPSSKTFHAGDQSYVNRGGGFYSKKWCAHTHTWTSSYVCFLREENILRLDFSPVTSSSFLPGAPTSLCEILFPHRSLILIRFFTQLFFFSNFFWESLFQWKLFPDFPSLEREILYFQSAACQPNQEITAKKHSLFSFIILDFSNFPTVGITLGVFTAHKTQPRLFDSGCCRANKICNL